jgi:hypothetical protein
MKLRLAETANKLTIETLNVQHRTSNIDGAALFRLDRPFFWPAAGLNTDT